MDLLLLLGLPLAAGLGAALVSLRYALEDEILLAFSFPCLGLLVALPLLLIGVIFDLPARRDEGLPLRAILQLAAWSVAILGSGAALLGWLIATLRR